MRPTVRGVAAWCCLLGLSVLLTGPMGGVVPVVVAAVLLAGLPTRLLGGLGLACVAAVPVAVVLGGVPSDAEVSPVFVSRSLVPHHLMFGGLLLVAVWVVLDMGPALRRTAAHSTPADDVDHPPPVTLAVGVTLVVVAAVAALAACRAVLGA